MARWRIGLGVACMWRWSSIPREAIDSYWWPFTASRGFCDNVFSVTLVSYVVYLCDFTLFNWLFTRVDVVSEHHKFGCAFLSFFSWESKIALFFKISRIPCPSRKIVCRITRKSGWIAETEKKDTASVKEGKVSLLRRGGQRLKAVLLRRKTWPRATKNIVQVAQPGYILVLVSWFTVKKVECL